MTDEEAVRRTLALYCQLCDDGSWDEFGDLFTDDAAFTVTGGGSQRGRDDIKAWIAKSLPPERRGKHVMANAIVDVDGDTATASTDFIFVAPGDAGPMAITQAGRYRDRFTRGPDGRWRFVEHTITLLRPLARRDA